MSFTRCDAHAKTTGEQCRQPAVSAGKCVYHGGRSTGPKDTSETRFNGLTHGATGDPANLLAVVDSDAREWIVSLADGWVSIAPFERDDPRYERLLITAAKAWQEWSGDREVIAADFTVDRLTESGETQPDTHYLAAFTSRLNRDIRANLKDLGVLGDETAAGDSLADLFATAVRSENGG